jgi:ABC-2 type transport system ATP-binding protein
MNEVIRVQGLSKTYGELKAVDSLDFVVNAGEVYGLLGQNGAGKSTTIRMLLSLVEPQQGTINMFGKDLRSNRHLILSQLGAMIERPDLYKYLSAVENLSIFSALSGQKKTRKELVKHLERVGLAARASDKVKTFSQGMKQRLGIAVALVHDPQLIILDEPTNGLDPQGIADIRNLILRLSRDEGRTILVSSHLLHEMELIADRMLIMDKGKKLVEGSVRELLDPSAITLKFTITNLAAILETVRNSDIGHLIHETQDDELYLKAGRSTAAMVNRRLVEMGAEVMSMQATHSLEQYFLSLTSGSGNVATYQN